MGVWRYSVFPSSVTFFGYPVVSSYPVVLLGPVVEVASPIHFMECCAVGRRLLRELCVVYSFFRAIVGVCVLGAFLCPYIRGVFL